MIVSRIGFCAASLLVSVATSASAQSYPVAADWTSNPAGVTTGGALADIDGDGALDFVVANGNDIARQRVEVYFNDGVGRFPTIAQWQSADVDYHGHLAVGDIDQDGLLDVAVSVFLGPSGFGDPGHAKVYFNQSGALETSPSWSSSDSYFTFSCDLGDADSDGDLDLAVATGEPYFDPPDRNRIYFNGASGLATMPGWFSASNDHALDLAFGDADGDGDLDLAFAVSAGPNTVFYQGAGGMATTPGWSATDNTNGFGNTIVWKDVDLDGFQELAVSDNDQILNGSGDFKLYQNSSAGLATTPFWTDFGGQVSAMAFGDLDRDGYPDLAGGIWFAGSQIYLNQGGTFPATTVWSSSVNGTVEALAFGDVDRRGLRTTDEAQPSNGGRTYYLEHAPVHELQEVRVDGVSLTRNQYTCDLEDGWIALDRTPSTGIDVRYVWSDSLDLGVTNWDTSVGNQVYLLTPRGKLREAGGVAVTPTNTRVIGLSLAVLRYRLQRR